MTIRSRPGSDDTGSIMGRSRVIALGTLASRATGFLRTAVIAAAIGTSLGDAYNLANTLPNIVYELLLGGVLSSVVVPLLVAGAQRDRDNGEAYAQQLLTFVGIALAGASVVAILLAPWIIRLYSLFGEGLPQAEVALATSFARYFLPQIFFYGVGALLGAILNTRGRFGTPAWAPVLNNLVVILTGVLFLSITHGAAQASALTTTQRLVLSIGTTGGIVVQTLALLPALRAAGFHLRPRFDFRQIGLGRSGRLAWWVLVYVLANQLGYLVIVNLASPVPFGISAYVYAYILFSLPHAIVAVSVITALLPRMSRSALDGRLEVLAADLARGLKLAGTILIPAELLLLSLAPLFATLVFSHYNLSADSARLVGRVLVGFAAGLVPFSVFQLQLRAFYALQDTRMPALLTIGATAVNLVADVLLYRVLHGEARIVGLSIGYSVSYCLASVVSTVVLRRRIGSARRQHVKQTYARLTVAALPGAAVAWLITRALASFAAQGWPATFLVLSIAGIVGAVLFLLAALRLRVAEVREAVVGAHIRVARRR